jgi:ComF family protein
MPESLSWRRKTAHWLAAAGDALASVFLPADCRLCEKLLLRASRLPICEACLASCLQMPGRICELCGQPLESLQGACEERVLCPNCSPPRFAFACARSLTIYEEVAVRAILTLKYERMEPLAGWFAARLAELVRRQGQRFQVDIVVPVPLHRARERERGYNQAALLAKPLAKALHLPYRPVLLQRLRERPAKRTLSVEERWEAVRGAFATRPGSQVDKLRVLLVDDVLTTGATLDACARALLAGGAQSVVGLTVARASKSPVTRSKPGVNPGSSPSKPEVRA